jgi:hypothetical protein
VKVGKITQVNYDQFKVKLLDTAKASSLNIAGDIYYFGNIGSYLKTVNTVGEAIVCEVVSVIDNSFDDQSHSFDIQNHRELFLKPVGTITKSNEFQLGIGIFPSIYNDVSILTYEDMEIIMHSTLSDQQDRGIHKTFDVGVSKNLINYPMKLNIDNFFNIHSAILGNSGSGKSNTIAHILQEVFSKEENSAKGSKFILFDVNGEYQEAFKKNTNQNIKVNYFKPQLEDLDTTEDCTVQKNKFYLPHFLLKIEEWAAFLMATEATQKPFWDLVLQESYRFYKMFSVSNEEQRKYINFFRYKVASMIANILKNSDTDTANITAASSTIREAQNILSQRILNEATQELSELSTDLDHLLRQCTISYGSNDGRLNAALSQFAENININDVQEVSSQKLKHGEYYDYKFLRVATELVLLEESARGNNRIREYTATMLTRLDYFLDNPDCEFMRISDSTGFSNSQQYLKNVFALDDLSSQLIIIDTSEISPDILEVVTSVISRMLFSYRKDQQGDDRRKKPIHLILDEAHRYIKKDQQYLLKENIFEKIAREGRKYSLYLMISSQRPSELSETVLSQCSNFIIHRIQNEVDMRYVNAVLPYFSSDFSNKIKQSTPGEALVFGNCVPMPLHLKIHKAKPGPNSENCKISDEWFKV